MKFSLFRSFQFISLFVNKILNLKYSKKYYFLFLFIFNLDIPNIKPNFVTKTIILKVYGFIIDLFLKLLNIVDIFIINKYKLLKLCS